MRGVKPLDALETTQVRLMISERFSGPCSNKSCLTPDCKCPCKECRPPLGGSSVVERRSEEPSVGGSIPSPPATPADQLSAMLRSDPAVPPGRMVTIDSEGTLRQTFFDREPTKAITAEQVRAQREAAMLCDDDFCTCLEVLYRQVLRGLRDHPGVSSTARAIIEETVR